MKDINHLTLTGRLVRDTSIKTTESGFTISTFSIATNRSQKIEGQWKDKPCFFECVLYGKIAETLAPKMLKGVQLVLEGELNQDHWEKDGKNHQKVNIIVNQILLINGVKTDNAGSVNAESDNQSENVDPGFDDDNIPF